MIGDILLAAGALIAVACLISVAVVVAQLWRNWSAADSDWGDE